MKKQTKSIQWSVLLFGVLFISLGMLNCGGDENGITDESDLDVDPIECEDFPDDVELAKESEDGVLHADELDDLGDYIIDDLESAARIREIEVIAIVEDHYDPGDGEPQDGSANLMVRGGEDMDCLQLPKLKRIEGQLQFNSGIGPGLPDEVSFPNLEETGVGVTAADEESGLKRLHFGSLKDSNGGPDPKITDSVRFFQIEEMQELLMPSLEQTPNIAITENPNLERLDFGSLERVEVPEEIDVSGPEPNEIHLVDNPKLSEIDFSSLDYVDFHDPEDSEQQDWRGARSPQVRIMRNESLSTCDAESAVESLEELVEDEDIAVCENEDDNGCAAESCPSGL